MRFGLVIGLGLLASCSEKTVGGTGCEGNDDCAAGQVCVNEACVTLCSQDADCPSGEICVDTSCQTGQRTDGPVILSINGDGTQDTTAGHAPNHIAHSLIVTGERLEGASVELLGWTRPALTVTDSQPGELTAALPTNLAAGDYTVRVFNAAGEDQGAITVLQGEQGDPGSDADLDGETIITRINSASGTISSDRLGGGVITAGQMTTLAVTGGSARSVALNGTAVSVDAADGVQLVVIDLSDHSVRTGNSVTGPPWLHNFTMAGALDGQNLASVIGELDDSYVVVLASRGDVFGQMTEWAEAAVSLGASRGVTQLGAGDTYILVGRPGLGVGNGLESTVAEADGGARIVTVLVDDDFLDRRDKPRRNYVFSQGEGDATLTCNVGTTAGWSAWSAIADLPARTIVTSGGPIRFQLSIWTQSRTGGQARYQFILNRGTATEQVLGECGRIRATAAAHAHGTVNCDFIETLAAGTYTVEVQQSCDDSGGVNPDAYIYCASDQSCTFFVEEL